MNRSILRDTSGSPPTGAPVVLVIGGTDPCGASGLALDLRTLEAHDVHAAMVVTAVTVQHPSEGVGSIGAIDAESVFQQIAAVRRWMEPQAIKIGLIPQAESLAAVIGAMANYSGPVITDPVLQASAGGRLVTDRLSDPQLASLGDLTTLWTPNVDELVEVLSCEIDSSEDLEQAARIWRDRFGAAVLAKGGHLIQERGCDLLIDDAGTTSYTAIEPNRSARGTGCALATAIASQMAHGESLHDAVHSARHWLAGQRVQVAEVSAKQQDSVR